MPASFPYPYTQFRRLSRQSYPTLALGLHLGLFRRDNQWFSLHVALAQGHTAIVMCLLSLTHAEALGMLLLNRSTLMHAAVSSDKVPLVDALIRRGVDFDARDGWGAPLAHAIGRCDMDVVRFLLGSIRHGDGKNN